MFSRKSAAILGLLAWITGCGKNEPDLKKDVLKFHERPLPISSLIEAVAEVERNPGLETHPDTGQTVFADLLRNLHPPPLLRPGKLSGDSTHSPKRRSIEATEKLEALRDYIYETGGVRFAPEDSSLGTILPGEVWRNGAGSCMGISLIWLMLGEQWGLPLRGVLLPGHFFPRYDDGTIRINLEPNRRGYSYSDEDYRRKYAVPDSGWYDLRSLTTREVLSVFHYTLGNRYLNKKQYLIAIRHLERATGYFPGFVEAMGNLALAYDGAGYREHSLNLLYKTKAMRGTFPRLYHNLGALLLKYERYEEALFEYRQGLSFYPQDLELLYGLAVSQFHGGFPDSAGEVLRRIRTADPGYPGLHSLTKALEAR